MVSPGLLASGQIHGLDIGYFVMFIKDILTRSKIYTSHFPLRVALQGGGVDTGEFWVQHGSLVKAVKIN